MEFTALANKGFGLCRLGLGVRFPLPWLVSQVLLTTYIGKWSCFNLSFRSKLKKVWGSKSEPIKPPSRVNDSPPLQT